MKCVECNQDKSLSSFYKNKNYKLGVTSKCKKCIKEKVKIIPKEKYCNKCKQIKEKEYFAINNCSKDGLSSECKECKLSYNKSEYQSIEEGVKICNTCNLLKDFSEFHKDKKLKDGLCNICKKCNISKSCQWAKNNNERLNKRVRLYFKNPLKKFRDSVRKNIQSSFARVLSGTYKKSKQSEDILGCTLEYFIKHIENLFSDGMSFENYGSCKSGHCHEVWHLDHVIPISHAKDEKEIIKLSHYSNFQPMWADKNLSKGNRI